MSYALRSGTARRSRGKCKSGGATGLENRTRREKWRTACASSTPHRPIVSGQPLSGQTSVMALVVAIVALVSGLHGIVTRGPITPVCRVGTPCNQPAVGAMLVFSKEGRAVARVRTGAGGRYAARLAPGLYTVRLAPTPRIGFGLRPTSVRVIRGSYRRFDFSIDTGIR